MADPVVLPSDLALYLKDGTIDEARATLLISDAQTLAANFLGLADADTFPANCAPIVARVAYVAYTSIAQARGKTMQAAGAGIGGSSVWSGVVLTSQDEKDLERAVSGSAGAFSIDMLPVGYAAPCLPWWDSGNFVGDWDVPPS
jgi:hypothetical protein